MSFPLGGLATIYRASAEPDRAPWANLRASV
jgi:hypothetical protein